MLNLSFVIDSLAPGGAEKITVDLINRIDRNRFNVTFYSLFNSTKLKDNIIGRISPGIKFVELDIEKLSFRKRFVHLRKALEHSDVIHTCLDMSNFYVPLSLFFRKKCKIIVSVHGKTAVFIDDPALKAELKKNQHRKYVLMTKYFQRIANCRINKFIALSKKTRDFLININGISSKRVIVHYYGYDFEYLEKSSQEEAEETRKNLGF
ncbi:MAG: glycosyltransferase, partial [Bacteroidetes bacterium]|nr:glycosyltransferase [Bacteroidota bacterium]